MTTTHQLMAAAFYLCGLFFLLHVDPVNSLTCKSCENTTACVTGERVDSIYCFDHQKYCLSTRVYRLGDDSGEGIKRECTNETTVPTNGYLCRVLSIGGELHTRCMKSCSYDNCNVDLPVG